MTATLTNAALPALASDSFVDAILERRSIMRTQRVAHAIVNEQGHFIAGVLSHLSTLTQSVPVAANAVAQFPTTILSSWNGGLTAVEVAERLHASIKAGDLDCKPVPSLPPFEVWGPSTRVAIGRTWANDGGDVAGPQPTRKVIPAAPSTQSNWQ